MKGIIYLIGDADNDGIYKIGRTKNNVSHRKLELQTGNANELYVRESFETDAPARLEAMMHRAYSEYNIQNEWFKLTEEKAKNFQQDCQKFQTIIDSLSENPFYKKY